MNKRKQRQKWRLKKAIETLGRRALIAVLCLLTIVSTITLGTQAQALAADLTANVNYTVTLQRYNSNSGTFIDVSDGFSYASGYIFRLTVDWNLENNVEVKTGDTFLIPITFSGTDVKFDAASAVSFPFDDGSQVIGAFAIKHIDGATGEVLATPITTDGTTFALVATFSGAHLEGLNNTHGNFYIDFNFIPAQDVLQGDFTWTIGAEQEITHSGKATAPTPTVTGSSPITKINLVKTFGYQAETGLTASRIYINENGQDLSGVGTVTITDTFDEGQEMSPLYLRNYNGANTYFLFDRPVPVNDSYGIFGNTAAASNGEGGYFKLWTVNWKAAYDVLYELQQTGTTNTAYKGTYPLPTGFLGTETTYPSYLRSLVTGILDYVVGIEGATTNDINDLYGKRWIGNDWVSLLLSIIQPVASTAVQSIAVSEHGFEIELADTAFDSNKTLLLFYSTRLKDPNQSLLSNKVNVHWEDLGPTTWSASPTVLNRGGGGTATGDKNSITIYKYDANDPAVSMEGTQFNVSIYAEGDTARVAAKKFDSLQTLEIDATAKNSVSTLSLGNYSALNDIVITETSPPDGYDPIPAEIVLRVDPTTDYQVVSSSPLDANTNWYEVTTQANGNIHVTILNTKTPSKTPSGDGNDILLAEVPPGPTEEDEGGPEEAVDEEEGGSVNGKDEDDTAQDKTTTGTISGGASGGIPPTLPPTTGGGELIPTDDGGFIYLDEDGTPLGEWRWDEETGEWIFEEYDVPRGGGAPLDSLPKTGGQTLPPGTYVLITALLLAALGIPRRSAGKRLGKNDR
ncbi:MAG: hypothetical protein LBT32_06165 [Peptococcaceae bacterium]|jgi:hypothetical protein|nr:hypothetical protein [Peptococcaceae bacterium]